MPGSLRPGVCTRTGKIWRVDVAFDRPTSIREAAHDFPFAEAFGGSPGHVVFGLLVVSHSDQHNVVKGGVGLPVATTIQAVPFCLPGRSWPWTRPVSAANWFTLLRRAGLSQAVMSSWLPVSGPDPKTCMRSGAWVCRTRPICEVRSRTCSSSSWYLLASMRSSA